MLENANIMVTGGAGTLGKALARRRAEEGWRGKLTVLSTDAGKHAALKALYPDVQCIQGDIRNLEALKLAFVGHEVVIHAAAVKFIPDSEYASIDTIDVNVYGSETVCEAARWANVRHVLGISTDKVCHPANAYGASKMLMEKVFQEHARYGGDTIFNLVRYGNVIESRGSVVEKWKQSVEQGQAVKVTDLNMTRFWLSPSQAVDYVVESLKLPSGRIYVPKMPGLSIGRMLDYTFDGKKVPVEFIPMRPGEKLHEMLLTPEETDYAEVYPSLPLGGTKERTAFWVVHPSTDKRLESNDPPAWYTSDIARELTREELEEILK